MYFRPPLNKIVKVRPALGLMKFCRYSHTNYSRQLALLKYNGLCKTRSGNPLLLATLSRGLAIGKSKDNESEARKSPDSRFDLIAPKNRKEMGDKIQNLTQKSFILKMCRHKQPSNYLSTFQTSSKSEGKAKKIQEIDESDKKYKANFCRHICDPCSSNLSSEIIALNPPSDHKVSKGIIEKLTDADIREICETKCPCKESHASRTLDTDIKNHSTAIDIAKSEKPTTTTAKNQDLPVNKRQIEDSADYFGTIFSSTNIKKVRRNRRSFPRPTEYNGSRQTNPIGLDALLMRPKGSLTGTVKATQSIPIRSSYQRKSKYTIMVRSKQIISFPTQVILPKYRVHPRLSFRIEPRQTCQVMPRQENQSDPRQPYRIGPFSAPLVEAFHLQNRSNANPCEGFVRNGCHFEELQPIPFRYRPLRPKNYHSDPVIENRSPQFDAMYLRMPYHPKKEWRNNQSSASVCGSKGRRNRQMLNTQPKMPKMITIPNEFVAASVNINNVTVDHNKAIASLPSMEIRKAQLKDLKCSDNETLQQSRQIMSKLVENLTVVVDGPGKLKLATYPYPQLRDEKDVIIQMEYVNLTDADACHYLTGKYNPFSYATTAIGRTGTGIIIETGQNVHDVKPGDRVFVKPVSCGKCSLCLNDHRNLCEYVTASELSPMDGVLSRLHVHSSEFVTKIPENVSVLNGAMTWTLSTAIRACQKASVSAGDVILVIGGGALGIATSLAAQLLGATTVCLADIRKPILDDAEKIGIEKVFQIDPRSPSQNTAIKLWEQISVYPRVTFDCTGSRLTNEIAISATQTGGKVVVMTNSGVDIPVPISSLVTRNIDLIISTCGNDESDIAALRLLSAKKVLFESYPHKHYDLSNADEAFKDLQDPNRLDSHIIVKCGCACGNWGGSEDEKSS